MSKAPIETISSLTLVMEDETRLLRDGRRSELEALARAKLKLTAQLEGQVARLERETPEWQAELAGEERTAFVAAVDAMQQAARENGKRLLRQIDLSRELMEAIAAEAKRIGGTRSEVYGAAGGLQRSELPAPISVNASL